VISSDIMASLLRRLPLAQVSKFSPGLLQLAPKIRTERPLLRFERKFGAVAQSECRVAVTLPSPSFSAEAVLPNGKFGKVSLSDYKGKYVVLFFYPLDFTFVCPTEILEFSDRVKDFEKLNAQVLGASCDSLFSHHAWIQQDRKHGGLGGKLNYPLIADMDRNLANTFGVLINGKFPVRGTFVIDDKGVVRHTSFNDPPVGRSIDEILRLIEGYQFTDKHGEVCPAGWSKGKKTIKPNPTDKNEYFRDPK